MFKGKICISRIDKIGDMILTLPVIKSVKIQNPSLEIHILASAYNAKVLKHVKYVDKVLLVGSNTRSFIKEIRQLRKIKYDFFINFSPNIKSFILCFFSKSQKKATLILLSRYRNNFFSKALLRIYSKIFCHFQYVVNRFERLNKNQELHQTRMMFNLIEECNIKYSQDVSIDIDLPLKKLFSFLLAGIIFGTIFIILTYLVFDSPKEKMLKREINQMALEFELLNKKSDNISKVLEDIQQRDDNIYRIIFEAVSL